jgi:hypothetical protein
MEIVCRQTLDDHPVNMAAGAKKPMGIAATFANLSSKCDKDA